MVIFSLFFFLFLSSASDESFKATLENMQQVDLTNSRHPHPLPRREKALFFKTPYLKGDLEGGLSLQSPSSELVVMVPGTFGSYHKSPEMERLGNLLYDKGYSILRLPNPQSSYVVKLKPHFAGLDYETEAELYKNVIEQVQQQHQFKKIHLVGVSYGAFVIAVLSQKMAQDLANPSEGQVILISPPKNLAASLTLIDTYFDELKNEITPLPWGHIWIYLKMKWATWTGSQVHLTPHEAKSLIVISGFHNQSLQLRQLAGKGPKGGFLSALLSRRQWSRKNKTVWHMMPTLEKEYPQFFSRPERHEVLFWMNTQKNNWHLYTTTDDFINAPEIWPKDPHITVYDQSGHVFSYLLQPDFEQSFLSRF